MAVKKPANTRAATDNVNPAPDIITSKRSALVAVAAVTVFSQRFVPSYAVAV